MNDLLLRPNNFFICSNDQLIRSKDLLLRPNESFICSNDSFIWSNDLLIRLNESPICSNDNFYYMASLRHRNFAIISLWRKIHGLYFKKLNPLHPRIFSAKFGWNWSCGSILRRRMMKMWKVYRKTDIRKAYTRFQLKWAKKRIDYVLNS